MKISKTKKSKVVIPKTEEEREQVRIKEFLDLCSPSVLRFYPDHYICGSSYRSVWAIRYYPDNTNEQALLKHLGDRSGITVRIYTRLSSQQEQAKIIAHSFNKQRMDMGSNDLQTAILAEENLKNTKDMIKDTHNNRERYVHCAVYIEMSAPTLEKLNDLKLDVESELLRAKITADKLLVRQHDGFTCVQPCGFNSLGTEFERVMPVSSTGNLYPFNYSGKVDSQGFYIGHDKYGSNLFVDFQRRTDDKTNSNVLILGNSGEGKSYMMKILITNMRESGMGIVCLDPEHEYADLTENLGGCYIDLTSGEYIINVLEPKRWDEDNGAVSAILSKHISFLRDFFRSYKDFTGAEIDVLEILLEQLYEKFGIAENKDFSRFSHKDYPILSDLYELAQAELNNYEENKSNLYTRQTIQNLCLKLKSICVGADSKYFNGHTSVISASFITFGVKGMLESDQSIKNAMLFNILSYMSDTLLTKGNTAAFIDELYLFLSNLIAIEYIRNAMKRVRKKDSAVVIASQNIEDCAKRCA